MGSYHITLRGDDINLGTSDANEATARRRQAVQNGRRNFTDDLAVTAQLEEGGAAKGAPLPSEPGLSVFSQVEPNQPGAEPPSPPSPPPPAPPR